MVGVVFTAAPFLLILWAFFRLGVGSVLAERCAVRHLSVRAVPAFAHQTWHGRCPDSSFRERFRERGVECRQPGGHLFAQMHPKDSPLAVG